MSFNWLHYLDLASELSYQAKISEPKEAKLRSSISRAYYAIFHKSRQYLEKSWGISIPKSSSAHQQVSDEFANRQINDEFKQITQERISANLTRMRQNRIRADYWERGGNLERVAQDTLDRAMQVISDLGSL